MTINVYIYISYCYSYRYIHINSSLNKFSDRVLASSKTSRGANDSPAQQLASQLQTSEPLCLPRNDPRPRFRL